LSAEEKADPRAGDRLYLWINESHGGRGLTATAEVLDDPPAGRQLRIPVTNVQLYDPIGIINNDFLENLMENSNVFDDIKNSAKSDLRYLGYERVGEIDEAVRRLTATYVTTDGSLIAPVPRVSRSGGSRGQGFRVWAKERLAVEERAMRLAGELLRSEGWSIADRSSHESYDLLCSREGRQVYAEVKGTSGGDNQIIITFREVEFAREHRQDMLLVVVSGIEIRRDENGNVSAHGGRPSLHWGWAPEESQLRPLAYLCRLRPVEPPG
jgi:hypothetical protein